MSAEMPALLIRVSRRISNPSPLFAPAMRVIIFAFALMLMKTDVELAVRRERPDRRVLPFGKDSPNNKSPSLSAGASDKPGNFLLSHTLARAVQSGLRGLTSVFGMGTGGSPSLRSPRIDAGTKAPANSIETEY